MGGLGFRAEKIHGWFRVQGLETRSPFKLFHEVIKLVHSFRTDQVFNH